MLQFSVTIARERFYSLHRMYGTGDLRRWIDAVNAGSISAPVAIRQLDEVCDFNQYEEIRAMRTLAQAGGTLRLYIDERRETMEFTVEFVYTTDDDRRQIVRRTLVPSDERMPWRGTLPIPPETSVQTGTVVVNTPAVTRTHSAPQQTAADLGREVARIFGRDLASRMDAETLGGVDGLAEFARTVPSIESLTGRSQVDEKDEEDARTAPTPAMPVPFARKLRLRGKK